MLLVDPLKRITIPEVRQHPWFTVNLPRYLAVMQADTAMTHHRVDEDMVNEVMRGEGWGLGGAGGGSRAQGEGREGGLMRTWSMR